MLFLPVQLEMEQFTCFLWEREGGSYQASMDAFCRKHDFCVMRPLYNHCRSLDSAAYVLPVCACVCAFVCAQAPVTVQAAKSSARAHFWAAPNLLSAQSSGNSVSATAAVQRPASEGRKLVAKQKQTTQLTDDAEADGQVNQTATVLFRGGEVMYNPVTVHFIWVGNWQQAQKTVVKTFVDSISSTDAAVTGEPVRRGNERLSVTLLDNGG